MSGRRRRRGQSGQRCATCGKHKPRKNFSPTQLRKRRGKRCKDCIKGVQSAAEDAAAGPKKIGKHHPEVRGVPIENSLPPETRGVPIESNLPPETRQSGGVPIESGIPFDDVGPESPESSGESSDEYSEESVGEFVPLYRWGSPYYLARLNLEPFKEHQAKLAAQKKRRAAHDARRKKKRQERAAEKKKKKEAARKKKQAEWNFLRELEAARKAEKEARKAEEKRNFLLKKAEREAVKASIMQAKMKEAKAEEERQLALAVAYSYEDQKEILEDAKKRPASSDVEEEEEEEGEMKAKIITKSSSADDSSDEMPSSRRHEEVLHMIGENHAVSTRVVRVVRDHLRPIFPKDVEEVLLKPDTWSRLQSRSGQVPQSFDSDNFRANDQLFCVLMRQVKRVLSLQKSPRGKVPATLEYPMVDRSVRNVNYLTHFVRLYQVVYWYNNARVGSEGSPVASSGSDWYESVSQRYLACAETARSLTILLAEELGFACGQEIFLVGSARDGTDLLGVDGQKKSDIDFNVVITSHPKGPLWLESQWEPYYEKVIRQDGVRGHSFLIGFAGFLWKQLCRIYRCEVAPVSSLSDPPGCSYPPGCYLTTIARGRWFFALQHSYGAFCQIEVSEWKSQHVAWSLARSYLFALIDEKTNGLFKSFSHVLRTFSRWLSPGQGGKLSNSVTCTLLFSVMCLLEEHELNVCNVVGEFFSRWEACAKREITSKDVDTMTRSEGELEMLRGFAKDVKHHAARGKIVCVRDLILPTANIAKALKLEFEAVVLKAARYIMKSSRITHELQGRMKWINSRKEGRLLSSQHKQDLAKVCKNR